MRTLRVTIMAMIHDITAGVLRNKLPMRKGRGRSAGKGKTAGRGTKGSGAHGGDIHWTPGREGGQTPTFKRFPKRGFSNFNFTTRYHVVNLDQLSTFANGTTVDSAALVEKGFVPDDRLAIKVLGNGAVTKKLTVIAGWYSKSAHKKITEAGGEAQNLKGEAFQFPKEKKKFVLREKVKKVAEAEETPVQEKKPKKVAAVEETPAEEKK